MQQLHIETSGNEYFSPDVSEGHSAQTRQGIESSIYNAMKGK